VVSKGRQNAQNYLTNSDIPSSATGWHNGDVSTLAPLALRHLLSKALPLFSWVFFANRKSLTDSATGWHSGDVPP